MRLTRMMFAVSPPSDSIQNKKDRCTPTIFRMRDKNPTITKKKPIVVVIPDLFINCGVMGNKRQK